MLRILSFILIAMFVSNCSPEHRHKGKPDIIDKGDGGDGDDAIPFSEVVTKVIEPAGCLDCHSKFNKYETVIKRVTIGDHKTSSLWIKSSTTMPPIEEGYLPLEPEQLNLIRDWIDQGARNE